MEFDPAEDTCVMTAATYVRDGAGVKWNDSSAFKTLLGG